MVITTGVKCQNMDIPVDKNSLLASDYRLFQSTPGWNLAKAVMNDDVSQIISEIKKNPALIDYTDIRFGQPILKFAIMNRNYESAKVLLKLGANPNKEDKLDGSSPLMEAARLGNDGINSQKINEKFLTILISYGANPNIEEAGPRRNGNATRNTPLLIASYEGNLDYVKILINAGANINYANEFGENILGAAVNSRNPDLVYYLLDEGIDFTKPIYESGNYKLFITNGLREWTFPIESKNYEKKMQIVNFLREHGLNYSKAAIPQKLFAIYSKQYLEKY